MKKILINILLLLSLQIAAFTQTGTLDPTFGTGGISVTPGFATVSVQQPDGKIVVVNRQVNLLHILRFMPDGSLDAAFGVNGTATFDEPNGNPLPHSVILQPDGKIVIAGEESGSYFRLFFCRLNANGSIDSSFANNGSRIFTFQAIDHQNEEVHNTLDGKLLISGTVGLFPRTPYYMKLKLDGSIDSTYGTNGVVFLSGLNYSGGTYRTKIQPDGKMVSVTLDVTGSSFSVKLFRLNVDGSFDSSFGINGQASVNAPYSLGVPNIEIQSDGKIIFVSDAGISGNPSLYGTFLARFLPNGILDAGFGTSGFVLYNPISWRNVFKFDIQPSDGKIVVFGEKRLAAGDDLQEYVARFNANGTFDSEFGEPAITFLPNNREQFMSGHIAADGGIIAIGTSILGVGPTAILSRILAKYISCANSITSQPQDISREEGGNATFTAGSSSTSAVYQWQIMGTNDWENLANGGQYSGVQTGTLSISNLTPANNGAIYRVISTSGVCVDTSEAAVLTVTPPNSINGIDLSKHFTVYPNPVKNKLSIKGDLPIQSVKVSDVLGREQFLLETNGQQSLDIELANLSPGVYWININTIKGTGIFKVVKE